MKKQLFISLIAFILCLGIVSLSEAKVQSNTKESNIILRHPITNEIIFGKGTVHIVVAMTEDGKGFTHIKHHVNAKFSGDGYLASTYAPSGINYEGKETLNINIKTESSSLGPGYHYTKTMTIMLNGSDGSTCKLHTNYHFRVENDGTINTFIDDYKVQ